MSADTVDVQSDIAITLEIGLERGVYRDAAADLGPGASYQTHDLVCGLNRDVPRELISWWLRKNRFLECVKKNRIRIVERESAASAAA
jgi:hypothetical protein